MEIIINVKLAGDNLASVNYTIFGSKDAFDCACTFKNDGWGAI